ncbi:hypothetical protein J6590_055436 [Homalodisca vitripennis]|nr:hypothetical protein J6590_055436 [Homalodisca vitripennis]
MVLQLQLASPVPLTEQPLTSSGTELQIRQEDISSESLRSLLPRGPHEFLKDHVASKALSHPVHRTCAVVSRYLGLLLCMPLDPGSFFCMTVLAVMKLHAAPVFCTTRHKLTVPDQNQIQAAYTIIEDVSHLTFKFSHPLQLVFVNLDIKTEQGPK